MKKGTHVLVAAIALSMVVGAGSAVAVQPAGVANLVGTWVNANAATGGTVKVVITNDATGFKVHTYGACSPTPCDHGTVSALRFSKTVSSTVAHGLSAQYNFGFSTVQVTAQRIYDIDGANFLELESRTRFAAGDTRRDYMRAELFIRQ